MSRPKAVVIGTGFIGPVHVEALQRAGIEVAGIIGSTPAKSQAASRRLGLPYALETLEDALRDPTIDAVHLATPNVLHHPQVKAVLAAGKHCLCEKPLAMNSAQSAELLQIANDSGLVAGVAYNIRFYPLCHEMAARVASAAVGEVIHITGSYVQDWLLYPTDFNWRVTAEASGPLRAVADIGTHWLDLVQFVSGQKVVSVCADLRTVYERRFQPIGGAKTFTAGSREADPHESVDVTTEDCGAIMLRFANGANGSLFVSQVTAGRKNCLRFELAGTKSALEWNSELPNQLWIGHRAEPNELMLRDPVLMDSSAAAISSYPGGHNEGFPDTFKQLFKSFYSYIQAADFRHAAPFPTFADGHQEVLLCEAILQSHHQRCWVDVPEVAKS